VDFEIVLFDHRGRPDAANDVVFRHNVASRRNQKREDVEGPAACAHLAPVHPHFAAVEQDFELPDLDRLHEKEWC
jgi:hypothetical protein